MPFPYGQAAAIESMGSIAAPLLAGLSATLAVLVIDNREEFRWPGLALFLLVAAAMFLVAAIQLTFWARRFAVTPDELRMWWPHLSDDDTELRWEQAFHRRRQETWARRARIAYNGGLLSFLGALTVAMVPPGCVIGYRPTRARPRGGGLRP
ncbi:MAG: hypothetical protein ICV64_06010 [Thermoleophilia bacterium]|nr:hypothetical protein [Thermoleophilia bacterium]